MNRERDRRKTAPPTPRQLQAMKHKEIYDQWQSYFFAMKPAEIEGAIDRLNKTLNGKRYDQMKDETSELIALGMHKLGRDKLTECQDVGIE
jgi:hypothetical protein